MARRLNDNPLELKDEDVRDEVLMHLDSKFKMLNLREDESIRELSKNLRRLQIGYISPEPFLCLLLLARFHDPNLFKTMGEVKNFKDMRCKKRFTKDALERRIIQEDCKKMDDDTWRCMVVELLSGDLKTRGSEGLPVIKEVSTSFLNDLVLFKFPNQSATSSKQKRVTGAKSMRTTSPEQMKAAVLEINKGRVINNTSRYREKKEEEIKMSLLELLPILEQETEPMKKTGIGSISAWESVKRLIGQMREVKVSPSNVFYFNLFATQVRELVVLLEDMYWSATALSIASSLRSDLATEYFE